MKRKRPLLMTDSMDLSPPSNKSTEKQSRPSMLVSEITKLHQKPPSVKHILHRYNTADLNQINTMLEQLNSEQLMNIKSDTVIKSLSSCPTTLISFHIIELKILTERAYRHMRELLPYISRSSANGT